MRHSCGRPCKVSIKVSRDRHENDQLSSKQVSTCKIALLMHAKEELEQHVKNNDGYTLQENVRKQPKYSSFRASLRTLQKIRSKPLFVSTAPSSFWCQETVKKVSSRSLYSCTKTTFKDDQFIYKYYVVHVEERSLGIFFKMRLFTRKGRAFQLPLL